MLWDSTLYQICEREFPQGKGRAEWFDIFMLLQKQTRIILTDNHLITFIYTCSRSNRIKCDENNAFNQPFQLHLNWKLN